MNIKNPDYLERKLINISCEIWNVNKLSRILHELLTNGEDNLTMSDICTLSYILTRTSHSLSKQMEKLNLYLKI